MAKLSDRELLEKFRDAPHVLEDDVLDRMPDRMGKVDVAGIAREIVQKLGYVSRSDDFELAQTILRSHLEGKSE
jgi:hypothetical protein